MSRQQNCRRSHAAGHVSTHPIETELSTLSELTLADLRTAWASWFNAERPPIRSRDILLLLFAWRIQADAIGGLDAVTERKLRDIAKALERDGSYEPKIRRDLSSGLVLTREWKGVIHKVTVTASGFQHLGKQYGSLSDIARTITGTRWSGPRFFGLEQKRARPSRQAAS